MQSLTSCFNQLPSCLSSSSTQPNPPLLSRPHADYAAVAATDPPATSPLSTAPGHSAPGSTASSLTPQPDDAAVGSAPGLADCVFCGVGDGEKAGSFRVVYQVILPYAWLDAKPASHEHARLIS